MITSGRTITTEAELRAIIGEPTEAVTLKLHDRIGPLHRQFIELSPFVLLGTGDPEGGMDVSPRGDPPGFVRILDERTLLIPERPGNRLADSLRNLLRDPRIALLFVIPGVGDTYRVNGEAVIVEDPELLAPSAVEGKVPRLGIVVSVQEAYTQCPKAFLRSDLWNPDRFTKRAVLPTPGELLRSITDAEFDAETYDRERTERYLRREGMY